MRERAACAMAFLVGLMLTVAALAQEGHPLTGTWYGDWGTSQSQRTQITVVMSWDGKKVNGIIDPGPDSAPLTVATLDSTKWTVHLEADRKDASGNPVHIVADGKLENIGSYSRTLNGTWTQGTTKADFKLKRD
jgi:predicted membrane metal-binding protein